MHEMSLAESVVEIIQEESRRQAFTSVKIVRLEIGAIGGVDPDAMLFCAESPDPVS